MKRKLVNYILSLCGALSLLFNIGLNSVFDYKIILVILLSLLIYYVYTKFNYKGSLYAKILASVFTLFLIIGNSYACYGTILKIFSLKVVIWTIIKVIGFYFLINFIISVIKENITRFQHKKDLNNNWFINRFNKHPLLVSVVILLLSWSIYYIAYYPIVLSPDPSFQIKQFLGEKTKYLDYSIVLDENVTITNHHPVVHTVLIGSFAKLGIIIGNDNFGLFLYSLFQGLFMAITLSYTICLLKSKKIKNKYLLIMLGIYALVPMFPLYAINGNKDVFYSLFVLWLLMFIFKYVDDNKKFLIKDWVKWFVVLLLICLFRNNGIYLVILLFPFVTFFKKENIVKMLTVFMLVITSYFVHTKVLLPYFKIPEGSIRETLSVVFQQTARYVINHEEELDDEDKRIIDNIIDYDNIKTSYDPEISDPIKNTYNKYATNEDLTKYFNVWLKGLVKHPLTYIDATLNNVYGYFDPAASNWYVYYKYDTRITNLVDYHYNSLTGMRKVLSTFAIEFPFIPIIGLLSNIGFSTWILFAMGLYLLINKKFKYIIMLLPCYISILVCLLSPVNTYFRYAMPYVYAIPFIIGVWFYINKKRII